MKTLIFAFVLTFALALALRAAEVTNTPVFFPAVPAVEVTTNEPARTNLTAPADSPGPARAPAASPRVARAPGVARFPRLDYLTITNGIVWPVPTGAAYVDVTGPTELKLAEFPEGAFLTLAIRNPANHPVYLAYNPTNTFLLTDQLAGAGRYLLHLQNIRGEIWVTK